MSYKSLTQYITEAFKREKLTDLDEITYPDGTVINVAELEDFVTKCFVTIFAKYPFFTPALKSLIPIWTNDIDTMATDGIRLFLNPKFTKGLSYDQCIFVLLHECMHNVLHHMVREKSAGFNDHERANIAADFEVNGILEHDGMVQKGTTKRLGGCIDDKYDGWAFERIYTDMGSESAQKPQSQQQPGDSSDSGQSGQGNGGNGKQSRSDDWKAGWNQAVADYNAGKLKI